LESGIADPAERFLTYADLTAAGITEGDVIAEVERHFNHEKKLSEYKNPLLILHTENDGMIDISHAERNYQWAGSTQKRLVRFPSAITTRYLGQMRGNTWRQCVNLWIPSKRETSTVMAGLSFGPVGTSAGRPELLL